MPHASERQLLAQADAFLGSQQWAKAERILRKVVKLRPNDASVRSRLGSAQQRLGQLAKASDTVQRAIQLDPDDANLHMQLAEIHSEHGQHNDAHASATRSLEIAPHNPTLLGKRARLLMRAGDPHAACKDLKSAHELAPDDLQSLAAYVDGSIVRGHVPMDTVAALRLTTLQPFEAKNHARIGTIHRLNGDHDDAIAAYEAALRIDRFNPDARAGKAEILVSRNQAEAGADLLRPLICAPSCSILPMQAWMRTCKSLGHHEEAIVAAERWLASSRRSPAHVSSLCHQLAQCHDQLDERDNAFNAWTRANAIYSRRWSTEEHTRTTDRIMAAFSAEAMQRLPVSTNASNTPVFILGMFRSGTSLTEQILASHPNLQGAGELSYIFDHVGTLHESLDTDATYPDCISDVTTDQLNTIASEYLDALSTHADSAKHISDKMPLNYLNIGFISLLFPNAKIIHCTRDPLDTCFSCWGNPFTSRAAFTSNQESLGHAYVEYTRIMDHWQHVATLPIHTIVYEDLVSEPEPIVRGMLEFLELDWDPSCLAFHKNTRVTRTLSVDQVNKPLTTSSIHRSRRYWEHLAPLRAALGDLAPPAPH